MPLYEFCCQDEECPHRETYRTSLVLAVKDRNPQFSCLCGEPMIRVLDVPNISFRGPGFHVNDYPTKRDTK